MEKIFYAKKTIYPQSKEFVKDVLRDFFQIPQPTLAYNPNGKPYLLRENVFFSISHTDTHIFLAVSDKEIGIDVENRLRKVDYLPILKRFSSIEQEKIKNVQDFLRLWTIKESVVKWLGGTLAKDLREIEYENGKVLYKRTPLPVTISFPLIDGHYVSICGENDFFHAEIYPLSI